MQGDQDNQTYSILLQNAETVALVASPEGKSHFNTTFLNAICFQLHDPRRCGRGASVYFIPSNHTESWRQDFGESTGRCSAYWDRNTRVYHREMNMEENLNFNALLPH